MRLLVTGVKGQLAQALLERGEQAGVEVATAGRPEADFDRPDTLEAALDAHDADVVVNAAAYTAVDKAENEVASAFRANAESAGCVAVWATRRGIPLLHVSTDYVFAGDLDRPYREDDPVGPIGAYGRSKLAGEIAVIAAQPQAAIFRTAWVHAPWGANFVATMLRLGETRDEVGVVADQWGSPTYAPDLADALVDFARLKMARPADPALEGVFHAVGARHCCWADFAEAIFARAAVHGRKAVRVKRITTADYPTPARRPKNSRLDVSRLTAVLGRGLPDWRRSADLCVDRKLAISS